MLKGPCLVSAPFTCFGRCCRFGWLRQLYLFAHQPPLQRRHGILPSKLFGKSRKPDCFYLPFLADRGISFCPPFNIKAGLLQLLLQLRQGCYPVNEIIKRNGQLHLPAAALPRCLQCSPVQPAAGAWRYYRKPVLPTEIVAFPPHDPQRLFVVVIFLPGKIAYGIKDDMGMDMIPVNMGTNDILMPWQHSCRKLLGHLLRLLRIHLSGRKGTDQLMGDKPPLFSGNLPYFLKVFYCSFDPAARRTYKNPAIRFIDPGNVFNQIVQVGVCHHRQHLQIRHVYSPSAPVQYIDPVHPAACSFPAAHSRTRLHSQSERCS